MPLSRIGYVSPFIPPEWIAAHGLIPQRLVPDAPCGLPAPAGTCSFAHECLATLQNCGVRAAIFTTTCDQMRRLSEGLPASHSLPNFLFNMPATWQTPAARQLYRQELLRLSRFLVTMGGWVPVARDLATTMLAYDAKRQSPTVSPTPDNSPRIALLGGPLRAQDRWIMDFVARAGAAIVLDATDAGSRTLPAGYDRARVATDPLAEIVRAYFDTIPDVFRRPDSLLYDYLRTQLPLHKVQGILLLRHLWCDLWHAQTTRLKQTFDLPLVEIDLGGHDHDLARSQTRIASLLELLR